MAKSAARYGIPPDVFRSWHGQVYPVPEFKFPELFLISKNRILIDEAYFGCIKIEDIQADDNRVLFFLIIEKFQIGIPDIANSIQKPGFLLLALLFSIGINIFII